MKININKNDAEKIVRSKIGEYNRASLYFNVLYCTFEFLSLACLLATPILLVWKQNKATNPAVTSLSQTRNSSPTTAASMQPGSPPGKSEKVDAQKPSTVDNNSKLGLDPAHAATFTSVGAVFAGLAKKYGWKNIRLKTKRPQGRWSYNSMNWMPLPAAMNNQSSMFCEEFTILRKSI